jgi:acetylornithine/N-succinyldiaminopimelate aminotransferase
VMVYGEMIQGPQVQYARLLTQHLPPKLETVYFTSSGAEAVEGAMKLAKKITGRTEVICFKHSYHGSTQGALSLIGSEYWRNAFRPLLPGVHHLDYNSFEDLETINENTSCVIAETVQAEAGIIVPQNGWLKALERKCRSTGTLLIFDEIQAGFGRTGKLWGFEHFDVVPDVLLLGKALGGGLPLGAFISSHANMMQLADLPVLGHITTFGGHPVSCVAGMAAFKVLLEEKLAEGVAGKAGMMKGLLEEIGIKKINAFGLWMALDFQDFDSCKRVIDKCIEGGVLTDWFLFNSHSLRISPPLTISEEEIEIGVSVLNKAFRS